MNKEALFSSNKHDWETPDGLFDALNLEFAFTLDAAADAMNAKCMNFISEEVNALKVPWLGRVWLNPPYGRGLKEWVRKAKLEAFWHAQVVVMLIPARTDTTYWHQFIWDNVFHRPQHGVEVRLLPGRLKFKGAQSSAPFPSAIIVFRAPVWRPETGPEKIQCTDVTMSPHTGTTPR